MKTVLSLAIYVLIACAMLFTAAEVSARKNTGVPNCSTNPKACAKAPVIVVDRVTHRRIV